MTNPNLVLSGGIRVIPSLLATNTQPRRVHKKTRSMTEAYHKRIQKKWTKRFGTWQAPGAFLLYGRVLYAHPEIVKALEEYVASEPVRQDFIGMTNYGVRLSRNDCFKWTTA